MATSIRRRGTVLAIGALAAVAMAACGASSGGASSSGTAKGATVGALRFGDDSSQVVITNTFDKQAGTYGWKVLPAQGADVDAGKQMSQIRALADQGATGIALTAVDANGIVSGVTYAASKGAKIVAYDNLPAGGPVYIGVTADQTGMAKTACDALGKAIGGKGVVLGVQGDQGGAAGLLRYTGLKDCLAKDYPGVQLVDLMAKWDASKAASLLADALTKYPKPAGIYLASDTAYLEPTLSALKAKGLTAKAGQPGHVVIATIDANPRALKAIRDGDIDFAVSQPLPDMGLWAATYLKDALAGKPVKLGPTDHNSTISKGANGYPVDLLGAALVSKDNVDDSKLWGNATK